jgi:hypothetical protein
MKIRCIQWFTVGRCMQNPHSKRVMTKFVQAKELRSICCLQKRKPRLVPGLFFICFRNRRLEITNLSRGCCCFVMS